MTRGRDLEPRAVRSAAPGTVQVWRGLDRSWRYRYVHAPHGTVIQSNRGYMTRDEAVASARVAYPGVPVVELRSPPDGEAAGRHPWKRAILRLSGLGLLALAARTIVRTSLRLRKSVRKARTISRWAGVAASMARRDRPSGGHPSR